MADLREVLEFIRTCSEPNLRTIVDIVRMKQQENTFKKAMNFHYGDTVSFLDKKGRRITGKVTKVNAKSIAVEVKGDYGFPIKWRVHPSLLSKLEVKPEPPKDDNQALRNRLHAVEELARRGATPGEKAAAEAAAQRLREALRRQTVNA